MKYLWIESRSLTSNAGCRWEHGMARGQGKWRKWIRFWRRRPFRIHCELENDPWQGRSQMLLHRGRWAHSRCLPRQKPWVIWLCGRRAAQRQAWATAHLPEEGSWTHLLHGSKVAQSSSLTPGTLYPTKQDSGGSEWLAGIKSENTAQLLSSTDYMKASQWNGKKNF